MVTGPSRRRRSDGDAARGGSERRRAHSNAHDAHDRQVAVLDAGRVAEVGPASELTARDGGAFARLVQAHSAG